MARASTGTRRRAPTESAGGPARAGKARRSTAPARRDGTDGGDRRRPRTRESEERRAPRPDTPASVEIVVAVAVAVLVATILGGALGWDPAVLRATPWSGFEPVDLALPVLLVALGVVRGYTDAATPPVGWRPTAVAIGGSLLLVAAGVAAGWLRAGSWASTRVTSVTGQVGIALLVGWLAARLLARRTQVLMALGALVVWWGLLTRLPVPGHGAGALTAAGNLAGWVDRHVLGLAHLAGNTDPHGLLVGVMSAVFVLAGAWTGGWLRGRPRGPATATALLLAGAYTALAGVVAAQVAPMIPALMTSAFVLLATGAALCVLAAAHLVVNVLGLSRVTGGVALLGRYGPAVLAVAVLAAGWLGG